MLRVKKMIADRRGATIVEAAIILPLYLVFVLGIIAWSLTLLNISELQLISERYARCSILPTTGIKQCEDAANAGQDWYSLDTYTVQGLTKTDIQSSVTQAQDPNLPATPATFQKFQQECVVLNIPNPFRLTFTAVAKNFIASFCMPNQV